MKTLKQIQKCRDVDDRCRVDLASCSAHPEYSPLPGGIGVIFRIGHAESFRLSLTISYPRLNSNNFLSPAEQ